MNDSATWSVVAIDTNVFLHLFNREKNPGCHIHRILTHLQANNTKLLIDNKSKIFNEYEGSELTQRLQESERSNEISILRYWLMVPENREKVSVNDRDDLMSAIRSIVHEAKKDVDRVLIYVAFSQGKNLISNDEIHIVTGPESEQRRGTRRSRLKRKAKSVCRASRQSEIMTSSEAYGELLS